MESLVISGEFRLTRLTILTVGYGGGKEDMGILLIFKFDLVTPQFTQKVFNKPTPCLIGF